VTGPRHSPAVRVGLIRLRDHCAFEWEQPIDGGPRVAAIRSTHCPECVAELGRLGYATVREGPDGGENTDQR
jgi:hypothetical protein